MARVIFYGDPFLQEVESYLLPDDTSWSDLGASGYVKDTFTCAMWAARNTDSFEECLIQTVNRRNDADTTGAVAGQIAGAMYGLSGIPDLWVKRLISLDDISQSANELYELGCDDDF